MTFKMILALIGILNLLSHKECLLLMAGIADKRHDKSESSPHHSIRYAS